MCLKCRCPKVLHKKWCWWWCCWWSILSFENGYKSISHFKVVYIYVKFMHSDQRKIAQAWRISLFSKIEIFKVNKINFHSWHTKNAPWACLEKGTLWFCFSGLLVVLCFKNIKNGWNFWRNDTWSKEHFVLISSTGLFKIFLLI